MKWLAEKFLKTRGWKFIGEMPDAPKFIVVGAPHTSNWDFIAFLGAISHWNIKPRYLGKHTLFDGPLGWLFRRWGGIPVDRRKAGGMIAQVSQEFENAENIALVIAPEGTRNPAPVWKSGFLTIASAVQAPIVPASVNFDRKEIRLGAPIKHTDDISQTMDRLRKFFAGSMGKNPNGMSPVLVKEESE